MAANRVKVGIVGLGRWAKVLTRAPSASDALEIVAGYSRSEESRAAFQQEFGVALAPDLATLLANPEIKGVILTVPNEQHLPLAREVAKAGKHVYTEKPIASTLEEGLAIEALEKTYGVSVTVGHSARLMAGIRLIGAGDRRRRARPRRLHGGQFLQRARARTHAEDVALVQGPRAGRAAVATRHSSVRRAALSRRRDRRGQLDRLEAVAGRRRGRRPVDDGAAGLPTARSAMSAARGRRPASSACACSARRD